MKADEEITAAYVGIGDELLSGRTEDTNYVYLARALRELGIRLMRGAIIPDDLEAIRETVDLFRRRYSYVFTSGGLGPTHDDVTVDGVARALGVRVLRHPLLERKLREHFGERLDEPTLKMAEIPEGAVLHFSDRLLIPVVSVENIYLFPGVPELFRQKIDSIKERFRSAPYHTEEIVCERFESEIADLLVETLERYPGVKIGSYPMWSGEGYTVKLVLESKDRPTVEAAAASLRGLLA